MSRNTTGESPNKATRHAKLKIKRDVVIRYYVQQGDWIYAGPFDTKEEARQELNKATL